MHDPALNVDLNSDMSRFPTRQGLLRGLMDAWFARRSARNLLTLGATDLRSLDLSRGEIVVALETPFWLNPMHILAGRQRARLVTARPRRQTVAGAGLLSPCRARMRKAAWAAASRATGTR